MTVLVRVEPEAFRNLLPEPRRLTVHACVRCLSKKHSVHLGKEDAAASVEWQLDSDCRDSSAQVETAMSEFALCSRPACSLPRAWLSRPRPNVQGFVPVGGVPSSLFDVKLLKDGATDDKRAYEGASFAFDRHYAAGVNGIVLGGYPTFRFELCEICKKPRHQLLYLSDYFTDDEFGRLFGGSNELTLLSCSRTPDCGGPERGLLVLDP